MRISGFLSIAVLCLCSAAALAQTIEIPAAPARSTAEGGETAIADPAVESYFRNKAAASGNERLALKGLRRTPVDGAVAAILTNDWLTYAITVRASDAPPQADGAPGVDTENVEAAVDAFFGFTPASRERIDATLRTLGVTLDDVLIPPGPPYYNNGRGLVYHARERRFLLVARGVRDASQNECFKAAIDLVTGNVLSNATTLCTME